ncbi:DUF2567 domain-containing protein [Salinifilum aidingensis]
MPEEPENGSRAASSWAAPTGPADDAFLLAAPAPRPRAVVKPDLLPGLSAASLVAMLGVPLGLVWSLLAPPRQRGVAPSGDLVPLLTDNYHAFDAMAIFALLAATAGAWTGAVMWMVRRRRGPVYALAGALGSVGASWLGTQLGVTFAALWFPSPDRPRPGDVLTMPPEAPTAWVVLVQPMAFVLVYALAAAWNGRDDLGRRTG